MIIFPMLFSVSLMVIFSSSVQEIEVQQVKLNCPYPVNAGIATLSAQQNFPNVNYTIAYDNDTDDYHVTIFNCIDDSITHVPQVNTIVYTADTTNSWFDLTNRASGYMFYISNSITSLFQKIQALGSLIYLVITAPAQVTGIALFAYVQLVLFTLIAIGGFMVIRG